MLSGIKVIPREELLDEDSLRADNLRKTRREYHHNSSDECSKGDERRARKGKKMSGTHNFLDIGSFCGKESNSDSDRVDKDSKSRKKRRFHHEKDKGKKRDKRTRKQDQSVDLTEKSPGNLRKEMGLDWMLQPGNSSHSNPAPVENEQEPEVEEEKNVNPKELNPYLRDNGTGYPDDASNSAASNLLPSSLVGDGGASWRLKALKRSKEQATREGRTLQEVVGERWDSLQELATSVAVHPSAPAHAHLHAIRERKTGHTNVAENNGMKKSKQDNLLWRSKYSKKTSLEDNSLISEAVSSINKFSNDGSFLDCILNQKNKDAFVHRNPGEEAGTSSNKDLDSESRDCDGVFRQALSSNQLAAKVLRLKMEGKHEEAENISKRMDALEKNSKKAILQEIGGSTSRCIEKQLSSERMKHEDNADKHLVQKIMQSKRYSISGSVDDEYDTYGEASSRKHNNKKLVACEFKTDITRQILTQKERCQFCFENPSRPKHLVVSIGNVTYLMLPTWEPVVQGHCCILPLQHESATRTIDKNVWEELRNFKKCLLKKFSREGKDVIFLETAIGLSRQHRHCLVECIPIPSYDAKQAPLYFKKAIDEAEGEWGQHDMKKVIPTSGNLRNVIPENFSYFHVEFGLDNGFVHVIDDDTNFPSSFGSNVIRGMLRLPEETMHRHQRRQPAEKQEQAIADFVREWKPFDWTSALD